MKPTVVPLLSETYMAAIQNSVDSRLFRNFYATVNGKKKDIMENGELSCAFFASSLLMIFGLIKHIHGTVDGTVRDMRASGWKETKKLSPGNVLVWETITDNKGNAHKHIGFYICRDKAVSNSTVKKTPAMHHITFGAVRDKPKRRIEAIFFHKKLVIRS